MLKELTAQQQQWVDDTLETLTLDEKLGQLVCERYVYIRGKNVSEWLKKYPVGSIYVGSEVIDTDNITSGRLNAEIKAVQHETKIQLVLVSDFEQGVGGQLDDDPFTQFPEAMAIAATSNPMNAYEAGKITALEAATLGVHWTLGTDIDLAINRDNPITLCRSYGSDPEKVIPFFTAHIRGLQEHNCAACAKHFPGDGIDTRNQHFVTSFNPLSKDKWMNTYGKIWKAAISEGVMSIMVGHIAMPELEPMDPVTLKYRPASASKLLMTDLLRGELGYRGLITTDALGMNGFCSWADYDTRILDAFNGGADVLLWPETERFFALMRSALSDGRASMERLDDAARHVLEFKTRLKLSVKPFAGNGKAAAEKIALDALNLLRNTKQTLPLKWKENAKYCVWVTPSHPKARDLLLPFVKKLREYGNVEYSLFKEMKEETLDQYDAVFLLNTARARYSDSRGWEPNIWPLLCSEKAKNRIVVGFANPFFLYDVPSCDAFINTYSPHPFSQRNAVRAIFGEIDFPGHCPVDIPGYVHSGDGLTLKGEQT